MRLEDSGDCPEFAAAQARTGGKRGGGLEQRAELGRNLEWASAKQKVIIRKPEEKTETPREHAEKGKHNIDESVSELLNDSWVC